jgi:hypothetical protein
MWDTADKKGYNMLTQQMRGQINDGEFFNDICKYASNTNYKTFLEIGTWNGLGSTRAFVNGFNTRTDDYIFYSLECNTDKSRDAFNLYKGNSKLNILNEVIWNELPDNFYSIFPQCLTNNTYKYWNEIDITNMKKCNLFLDRTDLPVIFDVVLLDGGEFTTYHEFQALKNKCKILMLDDINTDKCKLIVNELNSESSWNIIKRSNSRNGYLIAEKVNA